MQSDKPSPRVVFQPTHPLRGATPPPRGSPGKRVISTHAPLAGCDASRRKPRPGPPDFNPRTPCGVRPSAQIPGAGTLPISTHAPLAGCDRPSGEADAGETDFNPRTPCGVRLVSDGVPPEEINFNPRTPCGVRLFYPCLLSPYVVISTHAPLAGCDDDLERKVDT